MSITISSTKCSMTDKETRDTFPVLPRCREDFTAWALEQCGHKKSYLHRLYVELMYPEMTVDQIVALEIYVITWVYQTEQQFPELFYINRDNSHLDSTYIAGVHVRDRPKT